METDRRRKSKSPISKENRTARRPLGRLPGKGAYLAVLTAALTALFPFASRLLWRSISIDTEQMIHQPRQMLTSWLYHERPGLVLSKVLFGQTKFLYNVEIIGTIVFLLLACVIWNYFVRRALERTGCGEKCGRFFCWLFPFLFLTHPAMTEQFHFLLQSMEIAWALLLCLAAVGLLSEWLWNRRSGWHLLAGVLAMAWSFSSYQSMAALYIAAAAGLFLLYYNGGQDRRASFWWRLAFSHVAAFALGFALSRAFAKAGLYLSTGSLESTAYVAGMVKWRSRPAMECLRELYQYGKQTITGRGPYNSLAYLTAALATIFLLAKRLFRTKQNGLVVYLLAGVILYGSPFLLPLYLGGASQVRAQLAMPFVVAFGWSYLLYLLKAPTVALSPEKPGIECEPTSAPRHKAAEGQGRTVLVVLACLFCLVQLRQTICLTRTAYEVYRQEYSLSHEIAKAVEAAGVPEGASVQFVGRWSPVLGEGMVCGETIGNSFYEWDAEKAYGSTERILGLWETLGYSYQPVELQAAEAGYARAQDMPCWPAAGSVSWDGQTAVIKLSP